MKTAKYAAIPLALGVALAATTVSTSAAASTVSHLHHTLIARTVTLTNGDNGRTVTVARGDVVSVRLTGIRDQGNTWVWSAPQATARDVLQRTGGGTSPGGDATTVFRAVGSGKSDVIADRHCVAGRGHVCSHAVVPWKAAVVVR
ncbi:hypothetical protein [Streptomyces mirabilis]|uniref:hypothetical protein n=1 Tax=Streptomyces mirabilis TaxID=68239 RepID=UPI00369D9A33